MVRTIGVIGFTLAACSSGAAPANDAGVDAMSAADAPLESSPGDASDAGGADAKSTGFYGIPWNADALSNDQIGYRATRQADIRFLSHGGTFASAKIFFIVATYVQRSYCNQPPFTSQHPNNCYAAGTGGTIRVDLVDDDGTATHAPSSNVLATITITDPMNTSPAPPIDGTNEGNFRVLSNFSAKPVLAAGTLYHLLFTNTDPDPTENYVSIDCLYHASGNVSREPGVSDVNLATLMSDDGKTWNVRSETPIFQVTYDDATDDGQAYIDTRVDVPEPIAGAARARETFSPSATTTVMAVSLRLEASAASVPLDVRLEQSDGTLIEQGTIDASKFSTTAPAWATFTFAQSHVLTAGQTYDVLLTAQSDASAYEIYPLQKGASYAFDPKLTFADGHADYDDGDAGFVAHFAPWGDMAAFDYQIYFTTTP